MFIFFFYLAIYTVVLLAVLYYLRVKYHTGVRSLGFNKLKIISSFFLDLGLMAIFVIATIFYQVILRVFNIKIPSQEAELLKLFGTKLSSLILLFVITVVIAPIVEEMFFRGFLYQAIKSDYGISKAMWVSAIVFALFHFSMLVVLPLFILIGVMLAFVYERYKSLWASIMLHAMNNFVSFLAIYFLVRK
ncbi:MAG: CPBP family intramembrane metalloprotease [Actinobacteria bacterium]|nr:MAG: CPBP family intramembrane metalloprotease [Actinomycetota bacterium]